MYAAFSGGPNSCGGLASANVTCEQYDATTCPLHVRIIGALGSVAVSNFPSVQVVAGTFWQVTQPVSGTFWQGTQPVSGTFWQATQPISAASLPLPALAATSTVQADGTQRTKITDGTSNAAVQNTPAVGTELGLVTRIIDKPTTLHVTATAAVNAALTCTLPAVGAGLFHYITSVELVKLYSVIGVAAGAGILVTTTNLPGSPVWTTEQLASAAGTAAKVISLSYAGNPLKCSAANTATTFVAPQQLQTIWRWNVSYYTGN